MGNGHREFESGKGLHVLEAAPESDPLRGVFCFGLAKVDGSCEHQDTCWKRKPTNKGTTNR